MRCDTGPPIRWSQRFADALQSAAEQDFLSKKAEQEAAVAAAERRKEQMEQQNKLLHEQLEKLASQLPTGGVYCLISSPLHQLPGGSRLPG